MAGIGASLSRGFRWNSLNTRMVYTAESRALAMLEIAVHLDLNTDLPTDRYFVEIEIPDDLTIREIAHEDLPPGWDSKPPGSVTQLIGDFFVSRARSAVLKVPSSIVPQESNYLINPLHPDAHQIRVVRASPMQFDSRLKPRKI